MTRRAALIGTTISAIVLAGCGGTLFVGHQPWGHDATPRVAGAPEHVVVLDPATGAVIWRSAAPTRHMVILNPANGDVISSTG